MPRQNSRPQNPIPADKHRRYTIASRFGSARERRSRKNRPCNVCRRRKTACVIPIEPPCLFCRSRGLKCESAVESDTTRDSQSNAGSGPCEPQYRDRSEEIISTGSPVASEDVSVQAADDPEIQGEHITSSVVPHLLDPGRFAHLLLPQTSVSPAPAQTNYDFNANALGLEDIGNRTSHCMGLAAEQDTHVLDAFRSFIISDKDDIDASIIQVFGNEFQSSRPPVHFLILENEFPERTNRAMQVASDAIEAIVYPHGLSLIQLYFKYVHPAYPILSMGRHLRQYLTAKEKLPASLRGAVYSLAWPFWNCDASLPCPCPFSQEELVDHAHAALRRELEAPNLSKLQACLLLLHIRPPEIDSVETPSMWILSAQATACAQMIGLHQDPTEWKIAPWEKSLRKRLWWATYMADCWSAVYHGNPPHINERSYNTTQLKIVDLSFDEKIPEEFIHLIDLNPRGFKLADRVRFLESVKVSQHLRDVLDCSFQVKPSERPGNETDRTLNSLLGFKEGMEEWRDLIPHCLGAEQKGMHGLRWNAPLHLAYFATQVLLYRALMTPATREAKANPESNLRRWFAAALSEFQSFSVFMSNLTDEDFSIFWTRYARTQLILCGNFLIYLFLLASGPNDVEAAFRLLESFHQTLQRLGATSNADARLMLRPVMLRIDSFFAQAVDLLKSSTAAGAGTPATMA